jgi:hypothetical protein
MDIILILLKEIQMNNKGIVKRSIYAIIDVITLSICAVLMVLTLSGNTMMAYEYTGKINPYIILAIVILSSYRFGGDISEFVFGAIVYSIVRKNKAASLDAEIQKLQEPQQVQVNTILSLYRNNGLAMILRKLCKIIAFIIVIGFLIIA